MEDFEGGYEFEPLSGQIVEGFKCIICQYILKDTITLPCNHGYCSTCLTKWETERLERSMGLTCSTCNRAYQREEARENKFVDRMITTSVDVKCLYHIDGCGWTGKIIDYKTHKGNQCNYTRLICTNAGCEELVRKISFADHISNQCIFRRVQCEACKTIQTYHSLEAHFQQCPFFQIICPNEGCENVIKRNQIKNHLDKECFFHVISCEYVTIGCKEKFLRQELENHMAINNSHHMSLILKNSLVENAHTKRKLKDVSDRLAVVECELKSSLENETLLKNKVCVLNAENKLLKKTMVELAEENKRLTEDLHLAKITIETVALAQDQTQKIVEENIKDSKASIEVISEYVLKGYVEKNTKPQRSVRDWCFLLHKDNFLSHEASLKKTGCSGYNLPRLKEIRDLVQGEEHVPDEYHGRFKKMFNMMEEMEFYPGCTPNKLLIKVPFQGKDLGISLINSSLFKTKKKSFHCSYESDDACVHSFKSGINLFLWREGWNNENSQVELVHPLEEKLVNESVWPKKDWVFSGVVGKDMIVDKKFILVVLTKK